MKYKLLFYLFGGLSLLLVAWNLYMFSTVSGIQNDLDDITLKKDRVEGFNEVLEYDIETYKDSVEIYKDSVLQLLKQVEEPQE